MYSQAVRNEMAERMKATDRQREQCKGNKHHVRSELPLQTPLAAVA